jgi:agmatine deiminase
VLTNLVIAALLSQSSPQAAAEFAPQRAVWLAWPTYDHKKDVPIAKTTSAIIRELLKNVNVELLVPDDRTSKMVRAIFPSKKLNLRKMPYSEIWMRDFGPYFIGTGKSKAILDFGFNYWGYEKSNMPTSLQHEQIDRLLAKQMGLPTRASGTTGEGGDREANGDSVAMFVEEVEHQRNPSMTHEEIDEKLRAVMGVEKIIWLKKGIYEDGLFFSGPIKVGSKEEDVYMPVTTGGHMDNIARFVDKDTIIAAEVTEQEAKKDPIAAENRRRMEANFQILRDARDIHGKPFKIIRMPAADLHIETMRPGDPVYDFMASLDYRPAHKFPKGKPIKIAHAASYLNFLLTNNLVLTSKLYRPGAPIALKRKDAETLKILKRVFPKRRVVALESYSVNLGGGGIHCITANEPL